MNLQFDNLNELEQFLMFSAHIGRAFTVAPQEPVQSADPAADFYHAPPDLAETMNERVANAAKSLAHRNEQDLRNETFVAATVTDNAEQATTKRKRRTKAEIEAERAAGNGVSETQTESVITGSTGVATGAAATTANPTGANPFAVASPATQAILEAPNQSAATLAGIAAMQSNPLTDEAPAPEISSIDHLRACQSFIQTHGMTKYNESFKDGLHVNIVSYTPEQRARHVTLLNALAA